MQLTVNASMPARDNRWRSGHFEGCIAPRTEPRVVSAKRVIRALSPQALDARRAERRGSRRDLTW